MGKFIQFIQEEERKKYQWLTFEIDTYVVHILFETTLNESKLHGFPLGGQYSAQLHNAHSEVGQKHLHVYAKNNQIFSMNIDGTAHDKSHRTRIPNKVANAINKYFPDFTLPPDNFIESASEEIKKLFSKDILLLS
ncbi:MULTISPECIES: hypothetical protein [Aliarcobacter]|jgi:hypothetical protein|uniref:Uncharacterized protein n=1 Tax=Arcobacter sp. AZ-2023 TaxID=3074453 RepID=A0AA96DJQ2_9BACT|nr:hypothetical protein [Aliarcobacter butzleri]WNL30176.1 hypothetical protein RMQ68_01940 [Arcobacter sp. AZ-2023]